MNQRLVIFLLISVWAILGTAVDRQSAAADHLLGVEVIEDVLPIVQNNWVRNPRPGDVTEPMRVLLARERFWAEDRHLDVVVQLECPDGIALAETSLRVRMTGPAGVLYTETIDPIPAAQFIFFPAWPEHLIGQGQIELVWQRGNEVLAEHRQSFRVERSAHPAAAGGRIRLDIPNQDRIAQRGMPMTVGVPLPRGAVYDLAQLQLVDQAGQVVPVQIRETARWSKYGSLKWVLCDFGVDLDGEPVTLHLAYGPGVSRSPLPELTCQTSDGFPVIGAGRLRFDDGLWFDASGTGDYVKVLSHQALGGAFVEHEDGRVYQAGVADRYHVEDRGSQKVVLRREGWYVEPATGQRFCRYVTRYVIHRDSPLVRIVHTWIFTGDGNRDRIANMGWRFAMDPGVQPAGFLTGFGAKGTWTQGQYLVQHRHDAWEVTDHAGRPVKTGSRAPGVAGAFNDQVRLYFGTKDFWQNYPSELEFREGSLWFHNWPRHNRPATYSYDVDQLSPTELVQNAIRLRFAHEGEMLNFRLPEAFAQPHIHNQVVSRHQEAEGNWLPGEPDTANAQGIARTEEMWLYLAPANADEGNSRRLLEALDGERLRAVVDPQWVAASGAFYEIHHQDWENFPEDERMFALAARTPSRWIDRLELYGKWIYGDVATWGLNLSAQTASLYRTFRARHHGWPYSWIPYARSGDSELLKFAQASTRHMVDAAYCWHVSEDVQRSVGPHMHRRIGTWHRSLVPWAGRQNPATRGYEEKVDFAWHAYYLTNDARALDYIQSWAQQTKQEEPLRRRGAFRIGGPGQRNGVTLQKSYLEMYEATFDPWFLVAAHAIAKASLWIHEHEGWTGHFWVPAHREFLRYTGSKAYERFYLAYARDWGSHRARHGWDQLGAPMIEPNAYAWYLTGEDYFLRRVAGDLDLSRVATFRGHEPDYLVGHYTRGSAHMIYTGWWLQTFAVGLKAIVDSRQQPEPMGNTFRLGGLEHQGLVGDLRYRVPTISFVKAQAKSVTLRLGRTVLPVRAAPGEMAAYQVIDDAEQVVLAGQWEIRQSMDVQVPAELPGGVYRLVVDQPHDRGLDIPVTSMDVPEVFQVEPGQPLGWLRQEARLWFHVPGQVARFTVTFPAGQGVRQISIWGPDDELVWEHHGVSTRRTADITADIQVKPQQAGRLWRVTLPGSAPGLMMDPQIPPVFATEKSRWFLPQAHSPGSMQAD